MLRVVRMGQGVWCPACDRVGEVTGYVRVTDDVVDAVFARLEGLAPELCAGCALVMSEDALVTLHRCPWTAEEEEEEEEEWEPWLY
jgi:hypothetical protein